MEFDDFAVAPEEYDSLFKSIDEDQDYAFALSLQDECSGETKSEKANQKVPGSDASRPLGIVAEEWEVLDPTPDIHALFLQYDRQFFYGKLEGVEVRWSPRMTTCAGVCSYEGRGGLCSVRLSLPLLKLRPRRDLVETLLHEMIHAYLFVTANNKDHNAHGPEFHKHMYRINKETGTRISVYHNFHDEVNLYRTHWWKCDGPCQHKRPFYGLVRRAMNRAPGPTDFWWPQHQSLCGGTFVKIKEPENFKKGQAVKRKPLQDSIGQPSNIKKFLSSSTAEKAISEIPKPKSECHGNNSIASILGREDNVVETKEGSSKPFLDIVPFTGKGFQLGSSSSGASKSFLANLRRELALTGAKDSKPANERKPLAPLLGFSAAHSKKEVQKGKDLIKIKGAAFNSPSPQSLQKAQSPHFSQSSIEKYVVSPTRGIKDERNERPTTVGDSKVECPVCSNLFTNLEINKHLDSCLLTAT